MRSLLLTIPALLMVTMLSAQESSATVDPGTGKKTDSLLQVLKKAREDTNKVKALQELSIAYITNNNDSEALKYNNEAWALATKLGYIKGEARCAYITGMSYYFRNIYPEAIKYFLEAVMYWKKLKNDKEIISLNLRLSECLDYMGNTTLAFEKTSEALAFSIKTGDKFSEARSYQFIAGGYLSEKKYKEAKELLEKALKINQAIGDQYQFAQIQNTMAYIAIEENNFLKADEYISIAMKIYETPGAPSFGKPWCHTLFGQVNESRGDSALLRNNKKFAVNYYQAALKNLITALELSKEIDNNTFIIEKYIFLGRIYKKLHNNSLSRMYLLKAIPLTKEFSFKILTTEGYKELARLDSMEGNFKSAFENSKLYKIYSDSLAQEAEKGKTESFIIQAEVNKKEEEIKLLSAENKLKTVKADKESQRRKFAYTAIAAVLLSGGYGFYRYRRRKKIEIEQVKLKDRLNISRGLHDDMGSTLSSISVYSKVAQIKSEENNKEELNDVLEKISMASGEMVAEMNDTVWAINPGNDSLEKIIQRMESFARPLVAARNIHFSFQHNKEIHSMHLDMEKRKNFYLIFKEVINNAIKYSGASTIRVELNHSNNHFELLVKDDGVGFNVEQEMREPSLSLSGNGLRNMQMRTKEIKGELQVNSIPGKGTEIKLNFPIP